MVAPGGSSLSGKRSFAAFVATSSDGLRREVRSDARRRGLPADIDVDDVVQTAFVKLMPVYDTLDTEYAAYNYAHKTALRALSDARRRERVRHDGWLETVYRRTTRMVEDPEEEALRELRNADVRRAFGQLPDSQRRALALVDVAELRQSEAADAMGVSATTLKGLVQRGRESLRRELREVSGIAALFRFRKPSLLAPVATAPAFVVLAALVLTVAHAPAVPVAPPYVAEAAAPAGTTAVAAVAGPERAELRTPVTKPAPKLARATPRKRVSAPPTQDPPSLLPKEMPGGACVGEDHCVGHDPKGDEICVLPGSTLPCVMQSYVGVCPAVEPLAPVVTCTRHDDPVVDPPLTR
ncbi:MAG TPA: sigma-70 family RNA polymerase sigma factor [Frankiaceae bacterium]|nr:sigma-70 family RNA polymerase sigma factor [Frankiaceae bacterium]